jgi:hypothetical protein
VVFAALSVTAKYAVLYGDGVFGAKTNPLIAIVEVDPAGFSIDGADLTFDFPQTTFLRFS